MMDVALPAAVLLVAAVVVVGVTVWLYRRDAVVALAGFAGFVGVVSWVLVYTVVLDTQAARGMQLALTFAGVVGVSTGVANWWYSLDVGGAPVVEVDVEGNYLDIEWWSDAAWRQKDIAGGVPRSRESRRASSYSDAYVIRGVANADAYDRDDDVVPTVVGTWRDALSPDEAEASHRKMVRQYQDWGAIVDAYPYAKKGAVEFWREGRREGERIAGSDLDDVLDEPNDAREKIEDRAETFEEKIERIEQRKHEERQNSAEHEQAGEDEVEDEVVDMESMKEMVNGGAG